MAMEEKSAGAMTRRGFLTALGLAGASAAGAGLVGCAPKQPTEAAGDDQTALADTGTLVETDIPEEKILETVDCDVCVVGLGVAGVGALRSAAEGGLKVVGVEKGSKPSARSNMVRRLRHREDALHRNRGHQPHRGGQRAHDANVASRRLSHNHEVAEELRRGFRVVHLRI